MADETAKPAESPELISLRATLASKAADLAERKARSGMSKDEAAQNAAVAEREEAGVKEIEARIKFLSKGK